jgi:hypothetical protein
VDNIKASRTKQTAHKSVCPVFHFNLDEAKPLLNNCCPNHQTAFMSSPFLFSATKMLSLSSLLPEVSRSSIVSAPELRWMYYVPKSAARPPPSPMARAANLLSHDTARIHLQLDICHALQHDAFGPLDPPQGDPCYSWQEQTTSFFCENQNKNQYTIKRSDTSYKLS